MAKRSVIINAPIDSIINVRKTFEENFECRDLLNSLEIFRHIFMDGKISRFINKKKRVTILMYPTPPTCIRIKDSVPKK